MGVLNGVTTNDLTKISRHLLGIENLSNPSDYFAADVNYSGTITSFDIVTIRRIILEIDGAFPPSVGTWRYIPRHYLSSPSFFNDIYSPNPFEAEWSDPQLSNTLLTYGGSNSFMDILDIDLSGNSYTSLPETFALWAIKTGDVNCNAIVDENGAPSGEEYPFVYLSEGSTIPAGQFFDLTFFVNSATPLTSYQFAVHFDSSLIQVITPLAGEVLGFSKDNFGLTQLPHGRFRTLWYTKDGSTYNYNDAVVFKLRCRALAPIPDWTTAIETESEDKFNSAFYGTSSVEVPATIKVKAVSVPSNGSFSANVSNALVYPGVFEDVLHLQINAESATTVKVRLSDVFGNNFVQGYELEEGANNLSLEVPAALRAGFIAYQIEQDGAVLTGKLVKQSPR
jgi:hypothetical protein